MVPSQEPQYFRAGGARHVQGGGARRGGWTAIQTPVLPPLNLLIRGGAIAAGRRRTAVGVRGRRWRDLRACGCARERGDRRGAAARFAGVRAI